MRFAYVVLSHRNPGQVLRLVRVLREGPSAHVLVRHDQRHSTLPEAEVEAAGAVLLGAPGQFEWGGWSQLEALLAALAEARRIADPDWILVLSGQDYPLRPLADIHAELESSGQDALLGDAWELQTHAPPGPPQDEFFLRYAYRHFAAPRRAPRIPGRLRPLAYLRERPPPLRPLVGVRRRRLPFHAGFRCFVSADWLTLRRPALDTLLRAPGDRPDLMRFYRRSWIPSESLPATVLLNDPELRVARDNRRFISFPGPLTPHPDTLTTADLERVLASGCHFARKFDPDLDSEVLDALDEHRRSATPR